MQNAFNSNNEKIKPFVVGDFVYAKCNERMLLKLTRKFEG